MTSLVVKVKGTIYNQGTEFEALKWSLSFSIPVQIVTSKNSIPHNSSSIPLRSEIYIIDETAYEYQ